MKQIVLIFFPWESGHCSVRILLEKIGVGLERTRGNLLRKRESWSKRGPVYVVVVTLRRVAWRGVAWRGVAWRGVVVVDMVVVDMVERSGATCPPKIIICR